MKPELYQQCFELLEKHGAIRKDLSFGCEVKTEGDIKLYLDNVDTYPCVIELGPYNEYEVIGHPPVLTDILFFMKKEDKWNGWYHFENELWDYSKPYLKDQSDEIGEYIISLLS